jgi:hypothetical protein
MQALSEPEVPSRSDEPAPTEPDIEAEPEAPPAGIAMQDLLASYEQMEAWPIPPPDEGTAVIFPPRVEFVTEPVATPPPPPPAPAAEMSPISVGAVANVIASPSAPAAAQAAAEPLQTAAAPRPATEAALAAVAAALSPAAPPPQADPPAAPQADTEFDPADFLFGPEPEPDPAAFLLEPSSGAASEPSPPAEEPSAKDATPQEAKSARPAPDPLAPLNAMSEAERIAIFS